MLFFYAPKQLRSSDKDSLLPGNMQLYACMYIFIYK